MKKLLQIKKSFGRKILLSLSFILCLLIPQAYMAQNVVVSGALSGNGSYPDLNSAFTAINGGVQTSANIAVNITGSTTETISAVLNAGTWTSLVITPSGGTPRTITGSLATPLIDFNDADRVTVNGLNTGGNSLIISNTSTGNVLTTTIRLVNGATNNTITNCSILGSSTSATLGTITYSIATAVGNSSNTVSNCDIGPAGVNQPVNGIISLGTVGFENSYNTVSNCRISDFFSATLATRGILVSTNNIGWTISGNRFFQTGLRTYTTANTHAAIQITGGDNYLVSNNIIGYASSTATGTYSMTSTVATLFIGINISVGTLTASSVQGNTMSAVSLTTASSAATANGILCGINIGGGNVNVGNLVSNVIGGTSGVDLIFANPTVTGGSIVGINSSSTGTINISNNYMGGFTSVGTTAAIGSGVTGINIAGLATGLTISSNTIGNPTPDNMRAGTFTLTTAGSTGSGINTVATLTPTNILISSNVINNLSSYGTGTGGYIRGIWGSLSSNSSIYSIINNTITNLTSNNANITVSTGQIGTAGIIMATGTSCTVSGNYIANIANTGTATTHVIVSGICNANGTNTVYKNNRILNLTNTNPGTTITGPPVAAGFFIRSGNNGLIIANNFISFGNGQSSNTTFIGIWGQHGSTPNPTVQAYHNTINIEGTVSSGALPSFGIVRTDFSTSAKVAPFDVRNNLITNTRTGGTGSHYAIANNYGVAAASTSGWAANASNYNVLNAASGTVGWWTTDQTFAAWKTSSSGDGNSFSAIPVTYVNSATDLHLNMGVTPTLLESQCLLIPGISDDIDGQVRPGPVGSVNGGALAPDFGADEFDGKFLDIAPPVITYTALPATCSTGDRTLTAVITDQTGVSTTGSLVPMIYYKKNAGAYVSSAGVLASGTGSIGTWNFTLSASAMGGLSLLDAVSYYVIAQDVTTTFNTTSSPSVGLVATAVNAVTTPPTTPSSYLVSALNGTYTVGSASTFTSLTAAANIYNNSCLAGPVTYMLADALYSTSETFPIIFLNNTYASATNSLLIRPATSISPVITSSNTSILAFNGADFITLNGSNSGTNSRDLTVENTSTLATNCVLFAGNSSLTDAASNISIKNSVVTGSTGATTGYGIVVGSGVTLGSASDISNNNMTISGNSFLKTQNGVFALGNATTPDQNWNISSNSVGSTVVANKLGYRGIAVQNAQLFTINSNTIAGVTNSISSYISGVLVGAAASNGTISSNIISDIKNNNTTTTYGSNGIVLLSTSTTANILVSNNMISDVASYGSATSGINNNGYGIVVSTGAGYKIYHNTVVLNTNQTVTGVQAPILITSAITVAGAVDIKNNIFANMQTFGTERYAIYSGQSSNLIFSNMDNNSYSTTGPDLGYIGSIRTTLAALQTGFGGNLNSNTVTPVFVSATDLHLVPSSNGALDDLGTPIALVSTDIDNQIRSLTLPDVGADEFTGTGCASINAASVAVSAYTICNGQTLALSGSGGSSGSGIVQHWKASTTSGGPYTDVTTGNGFSTANLTTGTLSAGTLYYVLTKTCTTASLNAASNEVTVTINATPGTSISSTSAQACPGSSIIITASGAASYLWSTTATTSTIQVVPTANTVYTFTGTTLSCTNTSSFAVTYSANPVITATAASSLICFGNQATLTASGASTYSWTDGTTIINGSTVNPTPTVSTTYTVTGTATTGCVSAPITRSVSVSSVVLSIAGNTAVCPGGTASLTASGASTYTWSIGTNATNIAITPATSTVLTLSGTNSVGCSANITQSINVGNVSIAIAGPTAICIGQAVTFTATGGSTYTWNTTVNTTTLGDSPTTTTTYSVIGASGACSNTAISTLIVNPLPTIAIAGTNTICSGASITFTASGGATYLWNTASTATNLLVTPTTNTSYIVTGTSSLACSSSATVVVTTNTLPVITIAQTATGVCLTSSTTFTAGGASTYTWTGGPVNAFYTVTPTASTVYTLTGSNPAGCISSKTVGVTSYTLPVFSIVPASATVCSLSQVNFVASGANTYTWSGTSTPGASVSYTPVASIVYTVTGTSTQSCVSSTTVGVTTNSLPIVAITPPSATVCSQSGASFVASGASTYNWNNTFFTANFSAAPINSSTYSVTGTSSQGCSTTATVGVVALALPTVVVSPAISTVCVNSTGIYTVSGGLTYTWSSNSSNATTIAITPTATSAYPVSGTDINGCISSGQAVIITNPLPVITISPLTATVCPNTAVNFTASGANTYSWSTGIPTASAVITPSVSGIYTVTGIDANSCAGTQTLALTTKTVPVITISPASSSVCLNASASFSASGAVSYTWSNNTAGTGINVSPSVTTVYTVTGKNGIGCISTATANLNIWQPPVINIATNATTVCAKELITLIASGASTYTWYPFNVTGATFTNNPTNTIPYSVIATDANGCTNSDTLIVYVDKCTGIKQNTRVDTQVSIYPNPSSGIITANFGFEGSKEILVLNSVGALVMKAFTEELSTTIDLSGYAKGVYFVRVHTNGDSANYKIIIQ